MQGVTAVITIPIILNGNPTISNKALSGVIEANIVEFTGTISVVTKTHQFATGNKNARIIYISPYGNIQNLLVNLKRLLVGVSFNTLQNNGQHITDYVLGLLTEGSQEYLQAQEETNQAFNQGRRIVIAIATDCSDISVTLDQNKRPCTIS